ncbi:hypothetical protein FRC17_003334 [Serendipita sp. 399]|nr:hypothetical protein FRC17_003334 [Serendipita sp. 399]
MSDQTDPVSSRIPLEIWWKIFEDIFSLEDLFATTYDGDDWSRDAKKFLFTDTKGFKSAEEQRKILRAVSMYYRDDKFTIMDTDAIANTWRLYLGNSTPLPESLHGLTVQWRVLRIAQNNVKNLDQISYPHLRRLDFYLGSKADIPYVTDSFIDALKPFANITWLRYITNSRARGKHCLKDDEGEKLTLPHLQVLHYYSYDALYLPYYRLILPSLRYLAITAEIPVDLFPLRRVIAAYGETLDSLHIHAKSSNSTHPARDDLYPDDDPAYFPHWNHVPHLRDLSLGEFIKLNYHPLPFDHPLRSFTAHICKMSDISSWIVSGENLRLVRMLRTARDDDNGGLVRTDNDSSILDREQLEDLEAKVASKGLILEMIRESRPTK